METFAETAQVRKDLAGVLRGNSLHTGEDRYGADVVFGGIHNPDRTKQTLRRALDVAVWRGLMDLTGFNRLMDATAREAFERQLDIEIAAPVHDGGGSGGDKEGDEAGKLALARAIGQADTGEAMPRLRSERLEARLRRRWSRVHVTARVAQVDEVLERAAAGVEEARQQQVWLTQRLERSLFLPPGLAERLRAASEREVQVLDDLCGRLQAARDGFAALPLDDQEPAQGPAGQPEPVPI